MNRHRRHRSACLKSAMSGLMHRSKWHRYSITRSADTKQPLRNGPLGFALKILSTQFSAPVGMSQRCRRATQPGCDLRPPSSFGLPPTHKFATIGLSVLPQSAAILVSVMAIQQRRELNYQLGCKARNYLELVPWLESSRCASTLRWRDICPAAAVQLHHRNPFRGNGGRRNHLDVERHLPSLGETHFRRRPRREGSANCSVHWAGKPVAVKPPQALPSRFRPASRQPEQARCARRTRAAKSAQ